MTGQSAILKLRAIFYKKIMNIIICRVFTVSDGSDHRACCSDRGVPRRCLEWCRGEPVNNKMCVLSYSKSILACFHELRGTEPFVDAPKILQYTTIKYYLSTHLVEGREGVRGFEYEVFRNKKTMIIIYSVRRFINTDNMYFVRGGCSGITTLK